LVLHNCTLTGSRAGVALFASGEATSVTLAACCISDWDQAAVAEAGACLALRQECVVVGTEWAGVEVRGEGTIQETGRAHDDTLGSTSSAVLVVAQASADLTEGVLMSSVHGLAVKGEDTRAEARDCRFGDNREHGVYADNGAVAELAGCTLAGNARGPTYAGMRATIQQV
jgi:hypothetical protein